LYQSARTTPLSRAFLLSEADRIGVSRAARNMGVSRNTVYRWRRRAGELHDRSSRPQRSPRRTSSEREAALLAARLERRWGPDRIGPRCGISRRTAYRILRRFRMHRLRELFPPQRPVRGHFTADEPGEVVQMDIKSLGSLGRGGGRHNVGEIARRRLPTGWRHAHVAIDAASRQSYLEILPTLAVSTEALHDFVCRAAINAGRQPSISGELRKWHSCYFLQHHQRAADREGSRRFWH